MKLASLIFPICLIWFPRKTVLAPIAILLIVSFIFDVARLYNSSLNSKYLKLPNFSKIKERYRFSGYTLFLLAVFIVIAFFSKAISILSLSFFILGDSFVQYSGKMKFLPQKKIIGEKTIGGFIFIVLISIVAGFLLRLVTPFEISWRLILFGAFFTAIFDELSIAIDDNLIVPFGTAALLRFLNI